MAGFIVTASGCPDVPAETPALARVAARSAIVGLADERGRDALLAEIDAGEIVVEFDGTWVAIRPAVESWTVEVYTGADVPDPELEGGPEDVGRVVGEALAAVLRERPEFIDLDLRIRRESPAPSERSLNDEPGVGGGRDA